MQRLMLVSVSVTCIAAVFATPAVARHGAVASRGAPLTTSKLARPARPLPPRVPLAPTRALSRALRTQTPSALDSWQWRGHLCKYPDHGDPDPYPWHALTPYGTDPTGDTWIFSRVWFFSGLDLQTWSAVGTGPWWIQATGDSSLYWWWSGSTWQGPFQPDQAYTPRTYPGRFLIEYEAVVTEVWLWNGQWSGPYYHLETAFGFFALLDPTWACRVNIL